MLARRLDPRKMIFGLVALGLALRSYHYLRGRAVWHDEAALIMNVLPKTWGELLGPLHFHQAAPPLFLWVTKAVSLLLGDGDYALRLVPFLASCAALLLLASVARRLLAPPAAAWAVLLFACSETLSWHACEVKPYAVDVLCAALVLAVYVRMRQSSLCRRILVYALLAPALISLSFPATFLYGGVLAAHLPAVCRRRQAGAWVAYGLLAASTGGSFLLLALGPVRAQHDPVIHAYWATSMARWDRPWTVPGWSVVSSFEVCRYCCKPLGQPLAVLAAFGAVGLWRRGLRAWVVLLVVPVGLALVAACLRQYPYGGSRVMAYAAPAVALLVGAGSVPVFAWLRSQAALGGVGRAVAQAVVLVLLLLPAGYAAQRVIFVWPEADVASPASYIEARRHPRDVVAGNSWVHLYYFRRLGAGFTLGGPPAPPDGGRLWVVITDESRGASERATAAGQFAPPGWPVRDRYESSFTTALLFARPAVAPGKPSQGPPDDPVSSRGRPGSLRCPGSIRSCLVAGVSINRVEAPSVCSQGGRPGRRANPVRSPQAAGE